MQLCNGCKQHVATPLPRHERLLCTPAVPTVLQEDTEALAPAALLATNCQGLLCQFQCKEDSPANYTSREM